MSTPALISLRATEQLVDALNKAVELDGGVQPQIEFLLQRLQTLLDRPARCALWLMNDLLRKPAPRISSRVLVRPEFDDGPLGELADAQKAIDLSAPLSQQMVRTMLDNIRTPVTRIASESGGPIVKQWFESVLVPLFLEPLGYADCIISMWAATEDRAIFLVVQRREADPAFAEKDSTLVSLMLRAVAPIVDREIFQRRTPDLVEQLSPREREILLMLLAGESEKEIAAAIHRSVHTVHTFVQQLHRQFEVSSRGELMALFVDKAVVAELRQASPT